jgi:tetratricopeptide (TPR) repeat protein
MMQTSMMQNAQRSAGSAFTAANAAGSLAPTAPAKAVLRYAPHRTPRRWRDCAASPRCWLVLVFMFLLAAGVRAENPSMAFDAANKLYAEAKYSEAVTAYEKLIQAGQASAAIYFNMGNAFYKAGEIGRAISAYHRAVELEPRDPDLRANLQFARDQTQGPTLSPDRWQRALHWLTLNEWTAVAAGAIWLWFLLFSFTQWQPALKRPLRNALIGVAIAAVALCAFLAAAFYQDHVARTAIVVAKNVTVRHGPLPEAAEAFLVHDGAELQVLDQKDEWLQVGIDQHRIGWLRKDDVLRAGQPLR